MSLIVASSYTAVAPNRVVGFLASGGTAPYTYSVLPDGAGGSINSTTGVYTAPALVNPDPAKAFDVIVATDMLNVTAQTPLLVADALGLFCEILQNEMGLSNGRVYLWDQKLMQPKDSGLYIAVGVVTCKPFGNTVKPDTSGGGVNEIQSVNMMATLSIDLISRSTEALRRKEEALMALASYYSQSQQQANSFFVGKLPPGTQFANLSTIDGAAIPYRFNIAINIQYFVTKIKSTPYFDDFENAVVTVQP